MPQGESLPDDRWPRAASRLYEEEQAGRPFSRTVGLTPSEALRDALGRMVAHENMGFTVAGEGAQSVTFRDYSPPNPWVTVLLILPALLYWAVAGLGVDLAFSGLIFAILLLPVPIHAVGAGRHAYSTVVALPAPGGCVVGVGGDSVRGYGQLYAWVVNLPSVEPADEPAGIRKTETDD